MCNYHAPWFPVAAWRPTRRDFRPLLWNFIYSEVTNLNGFLEALAGTKACRIWPGGLKRLCVLWNRCLDCCAAFGRFWHWRQCSFVQRSSGLHSFVQKELDTWTKAFWVAQTGNEGVKKGKSQKKWALVGLKFGRAARHSIYTHAQTHTHALTHTHTNTHMCIHTYTH